ncbi:transactivator/viroplasmin protein [Striga asiatica]|uniref:Transactivator/viroplasmin protein n=1 Tax=Striga asiatica TaxID=4170 RepID=A0A5A7QGP0_STRAF|nr:transactivator/viroplasmin protein [Striga asiatica]
MSQEEESKDMLEKQLDELSKLMAAFDLGKNHENSDDEKSENQNDLVYGFSSDDEFEDEPADNPFNVKIEEGDLKNTNQELVVIKLKDPHKEVNVPNRIPYTIRDVEEFQQECQDLLSKDLIRESASPHSTPAFYVENHNEIKRDKKRMVINYKKMNKATIGYFKDLSTERKVLQKKLSDKVPWSWTDSDSEVVRKIKSMIVTLPQLYNPTNDDFLIIETDASQHVWAGCMRALPNGKKKLSLDEQGKTIALSGQTDLSDRLLKILAEFEKQLLLCRYTSGTFSDTETRYPIAELEVLAGVRERKTDTVAIATATISAIPGVDQIGEKSIRGHTNKRMEQAMKQLQHQLKQKDEQIQAAQKRLNSLFSQRGEIEETIKKTWKNFNIPGETQKEVQTSEPIKVAQEKVQTEDSPSKEAYVIFDGPMKGVYKNWNIAKLHIVGKPVRHQKYPTHEDALKAYKKAYQTVSTDPDLQTDRSLGYSKRIATQQLIQKQLKEETTEPNEVEFHRNWKWLMEYTKEFTQECFFPINSVTGAKAVFLTGASPTIINSFFRNGLVSTIYLQESEKKNYAELEELPRCIRQMANQFNKLFAKGKEIYLKFQSTYPYFDEGIIIKPKHIVEMGMANGSYPEIQKRAIKFTYKLFIEQIFQFYGYSNQWGTTQLGFKVLAEAENIAVISQTGKKATEGMVNKMIKFEEDLIRINGNFASMLEEFKHLVCEKLRKYEAHKCPQCPEDFPPLNGEEKSEHAMTFPKPTASQAQTPFQPLRQQ